MQRRNRFAWTYAPVPIGLALGFVFLVGSARVERALPPASLDDPVGLVRPWRSPARLSSGGFELVATHVSSNRTLDLRFSAPVGREALDRDRYRVLDEAGVPAPVYGAALGAGGRHVRLATGPLRVGGRYRLTLDCLRDLGGRELRRGSEVGLVVAPGGEGGRKRARHEAFCRHGRAVGRRLQVSLARLRARSEAALKASSQARHARGRPDPGLVWAPPAHVTTFLLEGTAGPAVGLVAMARTAFGRSRAW